MSHLEEQLIEKEAVSAIYPDGFEDISANEYKFQLPVLAFEDAFIQVHVRYPPEYPEVPADICSCEPINIRPPMSNNIVQAINTRHSEFVGEPYIIALSTLIEEITGFRNVDLEMTETLEKDPPEIVESASNPRVTDIPDEEAFNPGLIPGPPLTSENFSEWWASFCASNNILIEDTGEECEKPTGRQIWTEIKRRGTPICEET